MSKPALEDLLVFDGRRNRASYIYANLALIGAGIVGLLLVALFGATLGDLGAMVATIAYFGLCIAIAISTFAPTAQRLHDVGQTGWLSLLLFVPVAAFVMPVVLCFLPGDVGPNAYGPDTLDAEAPPAPVEHHRGGVVGRK